MRFINIFISNLRQKQQRYSRSQRVLHSLCKTLKHMTSSGRWVFRCAALWKRMCVKNRNKTRTVCGMYCAEYVASWGIWLRQLESLYRCCDEWLHPQFTSFCFSVLLDGFLISPLQRVYFCHFHFIVTKKFHLCCVHTHKDAIVNWSHKGDKSQFIKLKLMDNDCVTSTKHYSFPAHGTPHTVILL